MQVGDPVVRTSGRRADPRADSQRERELGNGAGCPRFGNRFVGQRQRFRQPAPLEPDAAELSQHPGACPGRRLFRQQPERVFEGVFRRSVIPGLPEVPPEVVEEVRRPIGVAGGAEGGESLPCERDGRRGISRERRDVRGVPQQVECVEAGGKDIRPGSVRAAPGPVRSAVARRRRRSAAPPPVRPSPPPGSPDPGDPRATSGARSRPPGAPGRPHARARRRRRHGVCVARREGAPDRRPAGAGCAGRRIPPVPVRVGRGGRDRLPREARQRPRVATDPTRPPPARRRPRCPPPPRPGARPAWRRRPWPAGTEAGHRAGAERPPAHPAVPPPPAPRRRTGSRRCGPAPVRPAPRRDAPAGSRQSGPPPRPGRSAGARSVRRVPFARGRRWWTGRGRRAWDRRSAR